MFTISYEIDPAQRESYLALSQEMKSHIKGMNGKDYWVFEQKTRKNSFTEVYMFDSVDAYDQLEDEDETMNGMIQRLETMLAGGKMKYTTLVELT
jgi:hypothetical protein